MKHIFLIMDEYFLTVLGTIKNSKKTWIKVKYKCINNYFFCTFVFKRHTEFQ